MTGTIGRILALDLAAQNEVWGLARFGDASLREAEAYHSVATSGTTRFVPVHDELEGAGIRVRRVDLASGDFGDLPRDFTYVLHLAWLRADLAHLEVALRANVEGAGLLLQHCRKARAALVMSGMGVYTGNDDPWWPYHERDPVGRGATVYAPTSPACKLGVESVARFCARAFDLPIVIPRLNTLMGPPESFPGMHIAAVMNGEAVVAPSDPTPHSPIHIDDMKWMLEPLLDAASVPALVTNWCGDDATTVQDWVRDAAAWSGREGRIAIRSMPGSPAGSLADPTRRRSLTGPCRAGFSSSFRQLFTEMTGIVPEDP